MYRVLVELEKKLFRLKNHIKTWKKELVMESQLIADKNDVRTMQEIQVSDSVTLTYLSFRR